MDVLTPGRRRLFSWLSLGTVGVLVGILAVLQYNWIGEVSRAEQKSLEEKLRANLDSVRRDFDQDLSREFAALIPSEEDLADVDLAAAYGEKLRQWQASTTHAALIKRAGLAIPGTPPQLLLWNVETALYSPAAWPESWAPLLEFVESRGGGRLSLEGTTLVDIPRFRREPRPDRDKQARPPQGPGERNWLFLEIDPNYAAQVLLAESLEKHLGSGYKDQYLIHIVDRAGKSVLPSITSSIQEEDADAAIPLFNPRVEPQGFRERPQGKRGPPGFDGKGDPKFGDPRFGPGPAKGGPPGGRGPGGRWTLLVRHQAGTLDAIVEKTRVRTLAVSSAVLLLLLGAAGFLLKLSRQTERLAEAQMDFVAGVSHELRTPLAVIRTASYNLRGKMSQNPAQVEKYGALIQDQSEKLGAIVEQVLRFSSARAGQVLQHRVPFQVEDVIRESLHAVENMVEERGCKVESTVEANLPVLVGDSMALRHAFQNLIANGLKYGVAQGGWMGVSARMVEDRGRKAIEVRVSDKGPGIPADEQKYIFDPFYRGKRAVADQVHGTGLGLSLVKKIVEAHGGRIHLESNPGQGATFVVTLPAPAASESNELAHSLG
jgi:signal transduction histidine kinase